MARFAASQPDLFASPPKAAEPAPKQDPIAALQARLEQLRPMTELPWTMSQAMQEQFDIMHLAKEAGPEGAGLANEVLNEFERLLETTD